MVDYLVKWQHKRNLWYYQYFFNDVYAQIMKNKYLIQKKIKPQKYKTPRKIKNVLKKMFMESPLSKSIYLSFKSQYILKLRKEMGNVSKRQQPDQRKEKSQRPPMGL